MLLRVIFIYCLFIVATVDAQWKDLKSAISEFIAYDTISDFRYDRWGQRYGYMIDSGLFNGKVYFSSDEIDYVNSVHLASVVPSRRQDTSLEEFCFIDNDVRVKRIFLNSDSLWVVGLTYAGIAKRIGGKLFLGEFTIRDSVLICKFEGSYYVYYRPNTPRKGVPVLPLLSTSPIVSPRKP